MTPTRVEALAAFPDAAWFVGDPAPVGTRVLLPTDANGEREAGTVVGVHDGKGAIHGRHCGTCACPPTDSELDGWFVVRGDRTRHETLHYPPSLMPLEDAP